MKVNSFNLSVGVLLHFSINMNFCQCLHLIPVFGNQNTPLFTCISGRSLDFKNYVLKIIVVKQFVQDV